jgi:hypothetical protein
MCECKVERKTRKKLYFEGRSVSNSQLPPLDSGQQIYGKSVV